jgi:hypothetical protein
MPIALGKMGHMEVRNQLELNLCMLAYDLPFRNP